MNFLLGAIALGLGALAKHYYSLIKTGRATNKEKAKQKDQEPIYTEIKKLNDELKNDIEQSNLAFQQNLQACHAALKEEMLAQNSYQDQKMTDSHEQIINQINKLSAELAQNNAYTEAVREGTLALWRKTYFADARLLLEPDHVITHEEYAKISKEHDTYNKLGGNHEGDEYFKSITIKYQAGLKNG